MNKLDLFAIIMKTCLENEETVGKQKYPKQKLEKTRNDKYL